MTEPATPAPAPELRRAPPRRRQRHVLAGDFPPTRRRSIATAALLSGAAIALAVLFARERLYIWHWEVVPVSLPLLLRATWLTLQLSFLSVVLGIALGLVAGLARLSAEPVLRGAAVVYVELVRGTPLLVQIFIIYFFVAHQLQLSRFTAGVLALAFFAGAYVAEIFRAGIESIDPGQAEAARSLGMSHAQAMIYVILPQGLRRSIPPLAGQFMSLIKDSSLLSVIAIEELTQTGTMVVSRGLRSLEIWFTVAVLYLAITLSLALLARYLERRLGHA